MRIRAITVAALIAMAAALGAAAFWEGTAVASNFGEFPQAGLYGACSSFPRNTLVEVQNLENGKTVQVIVTGQLDNPGVFISLSPEASAELGIAIGTVARVRVSMPKKGADASIRMDSPGLSEDPDLNPAALVSRERAKSQAAETGYGEVLEETPALAVQDGKPASTEAAIESIQSMIDQTPVAIGDQREAPPARASVRQPVDVPKVEERLPVAVEASASATDTPRVDGAPDFVPASARPPEVEEMAPEALVYVAGTKLEEHERSFALREPLLEEMVAREPLASAQAIERVRLSPAEGGAPAQTLADPDLEPRGMPESALVRLKTPSPAAALEKDLPPVALTEEAPRGEAEVIVLSGLRPRDGVIADTGLEAPALVENERGGPEAEALLAASRVGGNDIESALALPEIMDEGKAETGVADERLLVSRRERSGVEAALADPELGEEPAPDTAVADERLLASRREGSGIEAALADPELGEEPAGDTAIAEERLAAAKVEGRTLAEGRMPDPETQEVSLVATAEKPPEPSGPPVADSFDGKTVMARRGGAITASMDIPTAPESLEEAPALAVADRVEAQPEAVVPSFSKAEPGIPAEPVAPTGEKPPEALVSNRKDAEAAQMVLAGARRIDALSMGSYYVQIGVFKTVLGVSEALGSVGAGYPLSYQEVESKGDKLYKVFIGPLRKDEGGIVLLRMKSLGYRDAFLKQGN